VLDRAAGEALLVKLDEFAAELARFRVGLPAPVAEGNGLDVDDFAPDSLLDTTSAQERFGFPRNTIAKWCRTEGVGVLPPLAEAAAKVLRDLRYDNVSVEIGDGYHGWLECGPFDAIVVTAALGHVPPPLIEQLKVGGRLVMPLGSIEAPQQLTVVEKIAPSETRMRSITLVRFVPFTRSQD
jgi:Protein-L-isoaspartate(D-aspartate) O-methyltransferase (PCMT)